MLSGVPYFESFKRTFFKEGVDSEVFSILKYNLKKAAKLIMKGMMNEMR